MCETANEIIDEFKVYDSLSEVQKKEVSCQALMGLAHARLLEIKKMHLKAKDLRTQLKTAEDEIATFAEWRKALEQQAKQDNAVVRDTRKQQEAAQDEAERLRHGLILIRQSTEIMEARRFAEQALKEPK